MKFIQKFNFDLNFLSETKDNYINIFLHTEKFVIKGVLKSQILK
jgi:hypothetical protein